MGLDVYLYKYAVDPAEVARREEEYENQAEAIWEKHSAGRDYDALSDEVKATAREEKKALALSLGLDESGELPGAHEKVEIDSTRYPENMNKIGYLRSSYNGGGYNALARDVLGDGFDLQAIFAAEDEYVFKPDWAASLERAKATVAAWNTACAGPCLGVIKAEFNPFIGPACSLNSNHAALHAYKVEAAKFEDRKAQHLVDHPEDTEFKNDWISANYGTRDGDFFHQEPALVVGILHGINDFMGRQQPCEYLVVQRTDGYSYYRETAEIVVEFIEWVLVQPDIDSYRLHWSG